jgi:hypothetical protein
MVSFVAEIEQGPADTNEARLLYDGDGTDDRTGWPEVMRGRREQDRS